MATFRWFASLVLATTIVPASAAETHCPGNAASVPLRFVNRHQIVLAVSINHSGPYNFLLDTGMQVTTVVPSLAAKLRLEPRGAAVVAGIGSLQSASYAQLDLLEVGSQSVADQKVLVYDLRGLYSFDSQIQGVLGEDFLELFDVLIDNAHRLLCLDSSSAMRADVRGPHTALVTPAEVADGFVLPSLIIVEARLPDGKRPVRLMLDSGANGAILFNTSEYLTTPQRGYLQGTGVDGRQLIFSALPPQHVKIGSLELSGVPFVALPGTQKDSRSKGFDGVLTLGLFKRIFICHADHFVVLEPR
jgi:hypothetical protein